MQSGRSIPRGEVVRVRTEVRILLDPRKGKKMSGWGTESKGKNVRGNKAAIWASVFLCDGKKYLSPFSAAITEYSRLSNF